MPGAPPLSLPRKTSGACTRTDGRVDVTSCERRVGGVRPRGPPNPTSPRSSLDPPSAWRHSGSTFRAPWSAPLLGSLGGSGEGRDRGRMDKSLLDVGVNFSPFTPVLPEWDVRSTGRAVDYGKDLWDIDITGPRSKTLVPGVRRVESSRFLHVCPTGVGPTGPSVSTENLLSNPGVRPLVELLSGHPDSHVPTWWGLGRYRTDVTGPPPSTGTLPRTVATGEGTPDGERGPRHKEFRAPQPRPNMHTSLFSLLFLFL